MIQSVTCDLNGGGTVVFDVTDTEADDQIETFTLYDMFTTILG